MMESKTFSLDIGGRSFNAEFSDMAEQADGAAFVRYGDTMVLVTAVMSNNAREQLDYFPLAVDYEEKFYAAGMILGSRFMRREGRPSETAILTSRLIDRTIRPLFNKKIRNEVQVVATTLSIDEKNDPDVVAIIGASLALGVSRISWDGPVAAVRIGRVNDAFVLNPSYEERTHSTLDMILCSKNGKVNMIEASAKEIPERMMLDAIVFAFPELQQIETFQKRVIDEMGKQKKFPEIPETPPGLFELFGKTMRARLAEAVYVGMKIDRANAMGALKKEWMKLAEETFGEKATGHANEAYEEALDQIVHENSISAEKRPDGRSANEVRELRARVGILPRAHGSGLFYRGETHVLSVLTLGPPGDSQLVEGMEIRTKKRFMHHYNFPPYSSGETKPMRGPGRREIGHGALAERALEAVIPGRDAFPYTIRVVSESLSSNGSTSMGSICASTLALMDAGIPITNPVAGIAMGLMMKDEKTFRVLTDIQGPEDRHGDMDLKIAGTKDGVTAVQMDVKVEGIPFHVLQVAFADAKNARMRILDAILQTIAAPRKTLSPYAPEIITLTINPERIRDVIGPGGKTIQGIIAETETEIDVEQDGTVFITSRKNGNAKKAAEIIEQLTHEFKVGEVFTGKVTRIFDFGAMVEIAPKQEGLVHISRLAPERINKVTDVVDIGDALTVKIESIDEMGRINLAVEGVPERSAPFQRTSARKPSQRRR